MTCDVPFIPGDSSDCSSSLSFLADINKRVSRGVEVSISACWMAFALKEVGHFSSSLDGVSDPNRSLKSWRIYNTLEQKEKENHQLITTGDSKFTGVDNLNLKRNFNIKHK